MSLKAFHIVFITLSIVLSLGLAAWGVESYLSDGRTGPLSLGLFFFLPWYAWLFYSTLQGMSQLAAFAVIGALPLLGLFGRL